MAQMTKELAAAILDGDGITRSEIEQLCRYFLSTNSEYKLRTNLIEITVSGRTG